MVIYYVFVKVLIHQGHLKIEGVELIQLALPRFGMWRHDAGDSCRPLAVFFFDFN